MPYSDHKEKFHVIIQINLGSARASHALSTDNFLSVFDSRDMSVVLADLTAYNNKPGTCIENLSSSSGALYRYYNSGLNWLRT